MDLEQVRQQILGRPHFRIATFNREAINSEKRTVALTFASEKPIRRYWGFEILDHRPEMVNLERWMNSPPFLENHRERRGVIEEGKIVDGKLSGTARLSRNQKAEELFQDIVDGIAVHTSVGYIVHEAREMKAEEMDEELKKACLEEGVKAYRCSWEPLEGSSVDIPADISVGLGKRTLDYYDLDDISDVSKVIENVRSFEKSLANQSQPSIKGGTMENEKKQLTKEELEQAETERKQEIEAVATRYADRFPGGKQRLEQLAKDAIDLKQTAEQFRGVVFMEIRDDKALETPGSYLDLSEKDVKRYSITRAILQCVEGKGGEFEQEVSNAVAKKVGDSKRGGLYIPYDYQRQDLYLPANIEREFEAILRRHGITRRDLNTGTPSAGGYLVGTQHRPGDFIELLRNALIQGITILSGLSQNVEIPKQTGGGTIGVAATEGTDFSETAPTFGQLSLSPKDIGAYVEITRRLLIQSSPSVDTLVATDLITQLGLKVNHLALYGSGGSGEPTGAFETANIGTVNGASLGWPQVLEFISDIGSSNVRGLLQWLMNSTTQALLMGREKVSGYPSFLMNEDGDKMAGKVAQVSEQIANGHLALAKVDEIVLGEFGTMEVLYDRNTKSASGGLRIAIYHSIDVGLRNPGALSLSENVT